VRRAAKVVAIGVAALVVVCVLIGLLFLQQKENARIACAYRAGTVVAGECVTTTTRN
jgi:hypothetical protein